MTLTPAMRLLLQRSANAARESAPGKSNCSFAALRVCPDWRQVSHGSLLGLPDSGSSRLSFWLQQVVSFWGTSSDLI